MAEKRGSEEVATQTEEPLSKMAKANGVAVMNGKDARFALKVKKLSDKAVLPVRASPGAAGYDLSR